MSRFLLVEDDQAIAESVAASLRDTGNGVDVARTGTDAFAILMRQAPDVLLLDLGLPDMDGERLLVAVRAVYTLPVIVLTARSENDDIIRILDLGADDYIVKPFPLDQLLARIRAVQRRHLASAPPERWQVGELEVDDSRRTATFQGGRLSLRTKEFDLLAVLARHAGSIVPLAVILREVWGDAGRDAERSLDVHLSWLRSKLGESARAPRYIHRVHGVGIRLEPPDGGR